MERICVLTVFIVSLLTLSFAMATDSSVQCSSDAVNAGQNPAGTIVVCDDPHNSVCEQDFETICPKDFHLCSADEYNAGNDDWVGNLANGMLGEITCRDGSGAGHYSIWSGQFSTDVPSNQIAGSSLPQCPSDYGCNEKQYYALCCNGGSSISDADSDGVADDADNCPNTANPDQADSDNDGLGDQCDNCVSAANPDQADDDNDGAGNACDPYYCIPSGNEVCDTMDNDCDGLYDEGDVCETVCGDGVQQAGEECDVGELNQDDCTADYGVFCMTCTTECVVRSIQGPHCGDHIINGPEECDGGRNCEECNRTQADVPEFGLYGALLATALIGLFVAVTRKRISFF